MLRQEKRTQDKTEKGWSKERAGSHASRALHAIHSWAVHATSSRRRCRALTLASPLSHAARRRSLVARWLSRRHAGTLLKVHYHLHSRLSCTRLFHTLPLHAPPWLHHLPHRSASLATPCCTVGSHSLAPTALPLLTRSQHSSHTLDRMPRHRPSARTLAPLLLHTWPTLAPLLPHLSRGSPCYCISSTS